MCLPGTVHTGWMMSQVACVTYLSSVMFCQILCVAEIITTFPLNIIHCFSLHRLNVDN